MTHHVGATIGRPQSAIYKKSTHSLKNNLHKCFEGFSALALWRARRRNALRWSRKGRGENLPRSPKVCRVLAARREQQGFSPHTPHQIYPHQPALWRSFATAVENFGRWITPFSPLWWSKTRLPAKSARKALEGRGLFHKLQVRFPLRLPPKIFLTAPHKSARDKACGAFPQLPHPLLLLLLKNYIYHTIFYPPTAGSKKQGAF